MKKILALVISVIMLCGALILPTSADDTVNYGVEFEYTDKAPVIDGKIGNTEYGLLPIHKFSENKSQFDYTKNNEFDDWDFEFFATWDADNLYLAWEVETPRHAKLPLAQFDADGKPIEGTKITDESFGYLYMHSCVQVCITPGEPMSGKTNYEANYLNLGFGQLADDSTGKAIWNYPTAVTDDDIKGWKTICTRDEDKQITTYEIAIPWELTGVPIIGEDFKFGLSYVVFAQEHITLGKAGIQWQTGCFYQDDVNKAGVITLDFPISDPFPHHSGCTGPGRIPSHLRDKEQLYVYKMNSRITGEDTVLFTDIYGDMSNSDEGYNLNYTLSWALKPIENDLYEITEISPPDGKVPEFKTLEDDYIIIAFHSDGQGIGNEQLKRAEQYKVGTQIGLWGFDIEKNRQEYSNAFAYIEEAVTDTETPPDDTSNADTSNDVTSGAETSNGVTSNGATSNNEASADSLETVSDSPATSEDASRTDEESNAASVADKDEDTDSPIIPIIIIATVIVIAAAIVTIVIKKRK